MSKSDKLANLSKKFNLAENLIEELSNTIEEITSTDLIVPEDEIGSIDEAILSVPNLKQDFMLIRNNFIRLINSGQRILDSCETLEISDLKPSQLQSLSELQATIGNNLTAMMNLYESMAKIEKSRQKPASKSSVPEQNSGTINNNNNTNVFVGNSSELLKILNEHQSEPITIN